MRSSLLVPLLGLTLAGGVHSQTYGRHVFDVDPGPSTYRVGGSVTMGGFTGAIVGTPSTFNPAGAFSADLALTPTGIVRGRIFADQRTVVALPTVVAQVANPIPGLPALATIRVADVRLLLGSVDADTGNAVTFAVSGAGAFSTGMRVDILQGTATLSGLVNRTLPLAGISSTLRAVPGTVTVQPDGLRLQGAVNLSVSLSDPGLGVTGTMNLNGTLVGHDRMFSTDLTAISLAQGGTQVQRLSAGSAFAGRSYFILGTRSGTSLGISSGGVTIPVNFDGFTLIGLSDPNPLPYVDHFGVLDARGLATARFTLPPLPVALNLNLHHAYGVFNGSTLLAGSNAIPLTITP